MQFCWRRGVLILFVFIVFGASLVIFRNAAVYQFLFKRSFSSPQQVDVTEEMLLERLASSFPDIINQLSKMNPQQQKKFIEQVRRDTIAAASARGQSDEHAQKLGDTVAMAMLKAISSPSIADTYF
ncbi:hypothetical protein [Bartonella taylorii]|uniref:hypothetical protein n=1 Tax=Bartonella taylorii TaxID=33046 RepID=UPI001ABBD1EB|nr:hypothetical protein [Bartonella taylorii]